MAVPASSATDRTLHLQSIVDGKTFSEMLAWPGLSVEDAVMIANIITDFSYIDTILRRLIEAIDHFDRADLQQEWHGKTARMKLSQIENALQKSKWMAGNRARAFDDIREYRKVRNLVAHFVIRRMPDEDAFLFLTKSDEDFKRVYGKLPPPGTVMTGVADAVETQRIAEGVGKVLDWLCIAATELEDAIMSAPRPR